MGKNLLTDTFLRSSLVARVLGLVQLVYHLLKGGQCLGVRMFALAMFVGTIPWLLLTNAQCLEPAPIFWRDHRLLKENVVVIGIIAKTLR